jgi:hypothetical protein
MQEMNKKEIDMVGGGIFINPWTVMIAVRAGAIAMPYIKVGIVSGATAVAAAVGYEHGSEAN